MAQFAIQHASEIIDGPAYVVHANHLIDNFNAIISDLADRFSLVTGTPQTVAGAVTFSTSSTFSAGFTTAGTVTIGGPAIFTGSANFALAVEPTTPTIGQFWYSSTNKVFEGLAQITTISNATNATPIVVTTAGSHGFATGQVVYIAGVVGNTAANGSWTATVVDGTNFSLNTSVGNGAYTSGGTVSVVKTVATNAGAYPTGHHGSAVPVYASATTFTVANIRERDSGDAQNITKTGSTTVNIATTGINGVTLGSANLTGTVSVTSGAAGVTFSSTQAATLQVGDVITTVGGQSRRLSAGSGTSWTAESNWTSTETTVTVKRGGRAPNTFYNLYAISDGATPGLILSTRNVAAGDTLVDLPSGYLFSVQVAFAILTDGSSNVINFQIGEGWPRRPKIQYIVDQTNGTSANGANVVLSAGTSATFAAVSCAGFVPPIARRIGVYASDITNGSAILASFRPTGSGLTTGQVIEFGNGPLSTRFEIATDASQSIDYKRISGAGSLALDIESFIVTEVP